MQNSGHWNPWLPVVENSAQQTLLPTPRDYSEGDALHPEAIYMSSSRQAQTARLPSLFPAETSRAKVLPCMNHLFCLCLLGEQISNGRQGQQHCVWVCYHVSQTDPWACNTATPCAHTIILITHPDMNYTGTSTSLQKTKMLASDPGSKTWPTLRKNLRGGISVPI